MRFFVCVCLLRCRWYGRSWPGTREGNAFSVSTAESATAQILIHKWYRLSLFRTGRPPAVLTTSRYAYDSGTRASDRTQSTGVWCGKCRHHRYANLNAPVPIQNIVAGAPKLVAMNDSGYQCGNSRAGLFSTSKAVPKRRAGCFSNLVRVCVCASACRPVSLLNVFRVLPAPRPQEWEELTEMSFGWLFLCVSV